MSSHYFEKISCPKCGMEMKKGYLFTTKDLRYEREYC